jgi:L-rhamnose-H+ transport protein
MSLAILFSIGLIIIAGIMMGCSVVPMKYATKWKWENIWVLYIGFGQVVFPLILVALTVPNAWEVFGGAKRAALTNAILFGLGWGVGNVLAGIGYTMLGVGLGLSVVLGLTASTGSLVPLAVLFPERLMSSSAIALYVGVGIMLGGLGLSSQAGRLRQAHQAKDEITTGADIQAFGKGNVRVGLIACIVAGILSSMLNLAFVFGDDVRLTALRLGAPPSGAVNTLWLPILISGFLPTLFYCIYLLAKNRSWSGFAAPGTGAHWWIAVLMGLLYLGGLSLYGIGSVRLGVMGQVLGFPIFMSTIVLTGNTAGLVTGEWRGSPKGAFVYGFVGMLLLIVSIVIIAVGNIRVG